MLTSTRIPADHFVSGALIGAITSLATDKNEVGRINRVIRFSLNGAISTSCAILASNKIANKDYFGAFVSAAVGVAGVMLSEKILKDK